MMLLFGVESGLKWLTRMSPFCIANSDLDLFSLVFFQVLLEISNIYGLLD